MPRDCASLPIAILRLQLVGLRWYRWTRHCWTCLFGRRDYHSRPADLDIPLPCCSAPLPSTLRTPSTLSSMKVPGRGCWSGNKFKLYVSSAAVLRDVLPPVGLELDADLGVVKPPRKLQRDLTRAARICPRAGVSAPHGLASDHCVRDTRTPRTPRMP